jgi:hypothetical protein
VYNGWVLHRFLKIKKRGFDHLYLLQELLIFFQPKVPEQIS